MLLSVLAVMLDSVDLVRLSAGVALRLLEWGFTIVSAEMTRAANKDRSCRSCGAGSHQKDAEYCRRYGHPLSSGTAPDR